MVLNRSCTSHAQEGTGGDGRPVNRVRHPPRVYLSRGIPYLQLHTLAVKIDTPDLEINPANGWPHEGQVQNRKPSLPGWPALPARHNPPQAVPGAYPIVAMKLCVNASSAKRTKIELFPTPARRRREMGFIDSAPRRMEMRAGSVPHMTFHRRNVVAHLSPLSGGA